MRTLRPLVFTSLALATMSCAGVPISLPGGGSVGTGGGTVTGGGSAVANDIVRYTNDARAQNGLAPLASSSRLMEAARIQAEQMAQFQRADHTISGAQYPTMQDRLTAVGYAYMRAAENVAWNQRDAQAALASWMSSSGHRANILDPNLREMGAAMARSSKNEPYWVQVFGTPR